MFADNAYERNARNFRSYHVDRESAANMDLIRSVAHGFANFIVDVVPEGRELSLALTKLEEVVTWANSGISRHQRLSE